MPRFAGRVAAVWFALAADRAFGEPPTALHPVARFGQAMDRLEQAMWADRRDRGVAYTVLGTTGAAGTGWILSRGAGRTRWAALFSATYVAVAARGLSAAAMDVGAALEREDIEGARRLLRNLVGRDTTHLDEAEVIRATVESVAENTVDAITAPVIWALLAGAPGVLAYRAVNTLDAMVGHRSPRYERFGWGSARADDAANWLPARLTAAAVAAARPSRGGAVLRAVREQAPAHPSPNAGVVEAAFAAAMGIRLGGTNDYSGRIEERPALGTGRGPTRAHIEEACRLSRQTTLAICAAATAATALKAAGAHR